MTTNKDKQKKKPDFHIFLEGAEGNRYAGAAYRHKKGNGLGLIIGGQRYVAFPAKENKKEIT